MTKSRTSTSTLRRSPREAWRKLRPFLGDSTRGIVALGATAVVGGFVEAAVMVIIVRIAVALASGSDSVSVHLGPLGSVTMTIGQLFGLAFGLLVVRLAFNSVNSWLTSRLSVEALTAARKRTFSDFVRASWPVQSVERDGHLQEIMSTHVGRVSQATLTLANTTVAAFNFFALMVSAFLVNRLASGLIVLGVVILFFALRPITRAARRRRSKASNAANIDFVGSVAESVTLAQEVRTFDVGERLIDRVDERIQKSSDLTMRTRLLGQIMPTLYQNIAIALVLVGMGGVYLAGSSGVADLGAVVLILVRALSYSQQMQSNYHSLVETGPYLEELQERQALYEASFDTGGGLTVDHIGRIRFDDVWFSYRAGEPVLKGVSFDVAPGEAVGIVGPSGSGKSTMVQLLLRLRNPVDGSFTVDGADVADIALDSWYRRMAFVPQEPRLFRGTVADNIRFFRDHLTDDDVERAARLAQLHDDIVTWPKGYDTEVGERGGSVSGGQRQRIVLARALAERPDVLILDEPTSALDMKSESLVQETLEGLKGTSTMFIIAHRLSTLNSCDR
ncbi:MAG: ABC transporter ATP-binding protein, partial [Acidimicrobiales bacterium]